MKEPSAILNDLINEKLLPFPTARRIEDMIESDVTTGNFKSSMVNLAAEYLRVSLRSAKEKEANELLLRAVMFDHVRTFLAFKNNSPLSDKKNEVLEGFAKFLRETFLGHRVLNVSVFIEQAFLESLYDLLAAKPKTAFAEVKVIAVFFHPTPENSEKGLMEDLMEDMKSDFPEVFVTSDWPEFVEQAKNSLVILGEEYFIPNKEVFKSRVIELLEKGARIDTSAPFNIFESDDMLRMERILAESPLENGNLAASVGGIKISKPMNVAEIEEQKAAIDNLIQIEKMKGITSKQTFVFMDEGKIIGAAGPGAEKFLEQARIKEKAVNEVLKENGIKSMKDLETLVHTNFNKYMEILREIDRRVEN